MRKDQHQTEPITITDGLSLGGLSLNGREQQSQDENHTDRFDRRGHADKSCSHGTECGHTRHPDCSSIVGRRKKILARTGSFACLRIGWRNQVLSNLGQDFLAPGQHSQKRCCAGIFHDLAIDQDFEFPVTAANHLDIRTQLAAEPSRHAHCVESGDSIGAKANCDAWHVSIGFVWHLVGGSSPVPDAPAGNFPQHGSSSTPADNERRHPAVPPGEDPSIRWS